MSNEFFSEEYVEELISRIKEGDNDAWNELYYNNLRYVEYRANRLVASSAIDRNSEVYDELIQVGSIGMIDAVRNYKSGYGTFLTYATAYIDGEMKKELRKYREATFYEADSIDEKPEMLDRYLSADDIAYDESDNSSLTTEKEKKKQARDLGAYSDARRTLQILDLLQKITDEKHPISKGDIAGALKEYRILKYNNNTKIEDDRKITKLMDEILSELDPIHYTGDNDEEYTIKYKGYKEDNLDKKLNKKKGQKAPNITDFYYEHTFDYDTLDKLIQIISFTDIVSEEEKCNIISKLMDKTSIYYSSPFWKNDNIAFNPKGIHSRFDTRKDNIREGLSEKLQIIQDVINTTGQIRFSFNCYGANHDVVKRYDYKHVMSPYHLVVYHDNYYCIGLKKGDKRPWHIRVDLMSDIEILVDDDGNRLPMEICRFRDLPIFNDNWNPEKYMAEHINMGFDEPREMLIKVSKSDEVRYTAFQEWFGNEWELTNEKCEDGYEIVRVKTSPFMITHWAMQYGDRFEILDEEVRSNIREELKRMEEVYGE